MNFLSFSLLYTAFGITIIALVVGIIIYFKWSYSYWKRKNLPYLTPTSWYGTMENPLFKTKTFGIWLKQNYDELKQKGVKHGGIYNFVAPVYVPVDPEFVKNIMQNDFQYFVDRGFYYNEKVDPLSAHLFALDGQKWRNLRVKLTPTFTSGKMKMMFETLVDCINPLQSTMEELTKNKQQIDVKELVSNYTTDVIGSCAFGLECNSFNNPNSQFKDCGKLLFQQSTISYILQLLCFSKPSIGYFFNIRALPKSATDFLFNIVQDTVNYRKTNNVKRKDVLQVLIEMDNSSSDDKQNQYDGSALTIEEIAAQCLVFFAAGYETSSSTMTFCLYELAKNQEIQQKVRDEIDEVLLKHDGKITYDSMIDLKYMTQVIEETMRMYPSLPFLMRKCIKDYSLPNTNIVVEKGTSVLISAYGLHHDPDHYPNPEHFDPERFSDENKKGRHSFTYIPFGEGPRICLGIRFGMMQMKVCLTTLIKNYKFFFNQNTPKTITFSPHHFILASTETIWLDSKPVNKSY